MESRVLLRETERNHPRDGGPPAARLPSVEGMTAVLPAQTRPSWNTLAPIALALTFVTIVGGIVCGHVALAQIARTGERGRWMAVLALVIGYAVVAFFALLIVGTVGVGLVGHALR